MQYRVLGSVEVERDGERVAVGGPQQRRLLGVLLLARGCPVSTDRLVDALWPDGDAPDGGSRSVMTYVSRLRAALGDGHLMTDGSAYRLALASTKFDADEFEALVAKAESSRPERAIDCYRRALTLWRGPAFGEFSSEWWALAEATRLAELHSVAREERASALMGIDQHARAVPELEGLVLDHPLRERAVYLLMQALAATGRRAEALRVFHSYRSGLIDETGLDPSGELVQLERTIAGSGEASDEGAMGWPLRGYIIHETIGGGAHGRVYAATQPGTERRVAIKAIRPDLADSSEFVRRFDAEARFVARLEHPHIVPLYDYWREPGGAYLVFRFLAGGTARGSVIADGAWSVARVSRLVEEVGAALIAAHAAGVRHNDVNAGNVLLDERGTTYLTDFGIAVGTVSAGDVRDDVRGLGWTLWELLTGGPPSSQPTSSPSTRGPGPAPSLVGRTAAVPDGLDAVLTRATEPDGGYATVAELVLGWRAAVGRPDGVLSPFNSDERREVDAARELAARQLTQATAAGVNPYKGLRPFDEADAAVFFGRDGVVDDLERDVARKRLVTVVGASGSGKSSVVRAGLVPRLRSSGHTVVIMIPGDDPVAALGQALSAVSVRPARTDLTTVVAGIVADSGPLVVVIDQLEECWTRPASDHRSREFVDHVARMVDDGLDVRFVATIRADVFDRPLQDIRIGSHVSDGAFVLAPLSPAQLGDAITRPAARAGVTVDEAVVADLITEAATHPGSLPLFQFTLAELYDRRVDARIPPDALSAIGGMAGAIGRRAEQTYRELDPDAQAQARALFARLVGPGDGVPDTRRRAHLTELSDAARAVATRYVDARLLVTDRDPGTRQPTVELAHEALLSRWPRLATWVDADRSWLAQLQHLAAAARGWEQRGRPDAELYRGSRLEAAIEAVDVDGRTVSTVEREYVEAGRDARDAEIRSARRTARRLRRMLAAAAVALVVAVAAGAVAVVQRRVAADNAATARTEADHADSARHTAAVQALIGNSVGLRGTRRDLAALLAVEAHRFAPTPASESALFGLFTSFPGLGSTVRLDEKTFINGVGLILPDGKTIVGADSNGVVHLVDIDTGTVRQRLGGGEREVGTPVFAASADGRYLVSALDFSDPEESALTVWDLKTGQRRFDDVDLPFPVGMVAISADASQLAVGGGRQGRIEMRDAVTGALEHEIDPIPRPADAHYGVNTVGLAYAADGRLIVTSQAGPIRFLDPDTGNELARIDAPPQTAEAGIFLSLDGGSMITQGFAGFMRYALPSGAPLWRAPTAIECQAGSALPERLGAFLCGEGGGRVLVVDLATGVVVGRRFESQTGNTQILVGPDGTTMLGLDGEDDRYTRWRLDGGGLVSRLLPGTGAGDRVLGYTSDGRGVLVAREEPGEPEPTPVVDVVDSRTGETLDRLSGALDAVPGDRSDRLVAAFDDGTIGWYDLEGHERVGPGVDPGFPISDFVVQGSQVFAWADQGSFKVIDLDAGTVRVPDIPFERPTWRAAAPTPDRLYTLSMDLALQRRDPTSGAVVVEADVGLLVHLVAGPHTLIANDFLGNIIALDPISLRESGERFPPGRPLEAMALSADERRLTVLGGDRSVRLYDVDTRTQLGTDIDVDSRGGVAMRPDGGEAAVVTEHGIVVWDLDPARWSDAACELAGRNLTEAEWDTYIGDLGDYHKTCPGFP